LGYLALVARQEFLLLIIGGVFVAEALSVIVQVGFYKWRRRRILRCAPLHHHFQLLGWAENKIVVRFWIAAALCALAGVATLKLPPAASRPLIECQKTKVVTMPQDSNHESEKHCILPPRSPSRGVGKLY